MGSRVTCQAFGAKKRPFKKWDVDVKGTLAYEGDNQTFEGIKAKDENAAIMEAFRRYVAQREPEVPV